MKSIEANTESTIYSRKSKFICSLYKINSKEEADEKIKEVKIKYRDARHNCYAYILPNTKKCSDDGEPSGTAGLPILNILESNELTNVLAIVTRYFGGILLVTGGLIRAYGSSVKEALSNTNIIQLEEKIELVIKFNYDKNKVIDNLVSDYISDKDFDEIIKYKLLIPIIKYNSIKEVLELNCININEIKKTF